MSTLVRVLLGLALLTAPAQATFSIVARDPETGDLGVAVQSHYFSVGPIVPWAEPGVGAVATQSLVEVSYGPKGLQMMSSGKGAKQTLEELLSQDQNREVRQVAMIDSRGEVAAQKGKRSSKPWQDRIMDLRVEDNPHPIAELQRLVRIWRAYRNVDQGDVYATEGKVEEAMKAYAEGARLAPGNDEILFWQAASLWQLGREKEATPIFRRVFSHDRRWAELVPRLVPAGLLKDDQASIRRILALAGGRRR